MRVDPAIASVSFERRADTVTAGTTLPLSIAVRTTVGGLVQAAPVIWGSMNAAIATVDTLGVVSANRPGDTHIVASARGFADTLRLTVRRAPVDHLSVSIVPGRLMEGDSARLTIVLRDRNGAIIQDAREIAYASSAPNVAYVDERGFVYGLTPGRVTVTATAEQRAGTVDLEVTAAPVALIAIRAGAALLVPGGSLQLSVSASDRAERPLEGRLLSFRSLSPHIATVSATGLVAAHATGEATILVESEGNAETAIIRVIDQPVSSFHVDVRLAGTYSPAVAAAAREAVARWTRVITGDLPDAYIDLPAGACFEGTAAIDEVVDDLLLIIRIDSIDGSGGILGYAGPCVVRVNTGLPAGGVIILDAADMPAIVQAGMAVDLITHEIGHVLGIGSFWDGHPAVTGLRTSDPLFIGAASRAAQAAIGYSRSATLPVPIENQGGAGTRDAHWRESVFGNEIMTGYLSARGNPLSLITVNALADLGYVVTQSGAEAFAYLPPPPGGSAQIGRPATSIHELRIVPRWTVGADGRITPIR